MKYINAEGKTATTTATVKTKQGDNNTITFTDGDGNILQANQAPYDKVAVSLYMQHADHGCSMIFRANFNYITMHTTTSQQSGVDECQDY